MLILNVSNSHLSTCSVGVGEGLQPRSKGTGQIARQVLQSYFILLNSVTISESRGSSLTRFSISSGMTGVGSSSTSFRFFLELRILSLTLSKDTNWIIGGTQVPPLDSGTTLHSPVERLGIARPS